MHSLNKILILTPIKISYSYIIIAKDNKENKGWVALFIYFQLWDKYCVLRNVKH